ncbi:hypothetical protein CERSUDRAFT_59841 [Gelatoporia subvermispora B]|uniref:Yeast cell wall synthesis Kre9/Knh1-like N-terminal domain-containing protein n=1 Tax=Ceriporiopsis subvermispora (strain B) TaxID=914234 RepID=M2QHE4_CERS8|nr:hypothetical protein CERSUDRAFT_59841 [Gelatoporia subvermispora B]
MRSFAVALVLAASASAYTVTYPTNDTIWTANGPNTVSWIMVNTDPQNFTIVLSNQNHYPPTQQVLAGFVTGNQGSATVNSPSGGLTPGNGYQVNLVKDAYHMDTILAQSNQFTIN